MHKINHVPTPEDRLTQIALDRCERILVSMDRLLVRVWLDGYKYRAEEILEGQTIPVDSFSHKGVAPDPAQGFFESSTLPVSPPTPPYTPKPPEPVRTYEIPTDALPQGWRKVYHLRGEYPCGRAALIITRPVYADEKASLEVLRFVNGTKPTPEEAPLCGGCGQPIHPWSNADLEWEPHKLPARRSYSVSFADLAPDAPLPTTPRTPVSVFADMRTAVHERFSTTDDEDVSPPIIGAVDEIDEIRKLHEELGLPLDQDIADSPTTSKDS